MKKLMTSLAVAATIASPVALANSTPVMFSTIDHTNAPSNSAVGGVRLAVLHGQVNEVKGVDFSVLGMSETDRTTGVNFGLFFWAAKVNQEMKCASLGF
ncbi:VC2662 family protein, partial [Vibrio sp. 1288]|uniref:VC2662 family protein n=1 Tax=Vibrio sp. 1288 TaxID=3074550 RepID=UPI0029686AA1|nr:phaC PHA synthase [Vibrio sp. 1288]